MKKLLSAFLIIAAMILCATLLPTEAEAATYGNLTYTISNGEVTITDCNTSASGEMVIPSTIEGYPVTSIGGCAFQSCDSLTSVTIPDSVTSIGNGTFQYCDRLTSVTIGNSVTTIGSNAFDDCTSLTSVTIPDSVTSIGNSAFLNCDSLTSVTIGNGVTSIGDYAFISCNSLISVTIPDSVTSIGIQAFFYCTSLTSVTIPDSVTSIGSLAFYKCTSLTSVTIPDSVTSIGDNAFWGCTSLTGITVSENNTNYSSDAQGILYNKDKTVLIQAPGAITTCVIPGSVTSIGRLAFDSCTSLTSVTIPGSVKTIGGYAFSDCTSLTSVTIPDSVTSIGEGAFDYCNSLTGVTIGNGVTSIGSNAFRNCGSLTSVTIGNGVKTIGKSAFSDCESLTSVTYYGTEEQWNRITIGSYNHPLLNAERTYITAPVQDATLVMRNDGALNLAAFIGAQFSVTKEVAGKYDTVYVEISHNGLTKTIELKANEDGTVYFAEYGIAAKQMTDPIDIKLFAKKGDTTYVGQVVEGWTVKAKLVSMLDQYYQWMSYDDAYKNTSELAAATLAYGAAAQKQFNYNLDNLATDGVNADYLALVPTEAPAMEAMPTFNNSGKQASLYNPAFILDDVIKASLTFSIGDTKIENYKARVTINGVTTDYDLTQYVLSGTAYPGYAYIIIDSIVAADLRNDFSVTIVKGDTAVSTTYTFSMENMAAKLVADRTDIITAIMNYSDAAHARFRA